MARLFISTEFKKHSFISSHMPNQSNINSMNGWDKWIMGILNKQTDTAEEGRVVGCIV